VLQDPTNKVDLITIFTVTCDTVALLGVCCLGHIEHRRSVQPSDAIVSYVLASSVCDAIWVFQPRSNHDLVSHGLIQVVVAQLLLKLLLLLLESHGKESALYSNYQGGSPEETAGLLRRALFWWVNGILKSGSKAGLCEKDLPVLDSRLSSKALRNDVLTRWDERRTFAMETSFLLTDLWHSQVWKQVCIAIGTPTNGFHAVLCCDIPSLLLDTLPIRPAHID
jgi:hypothetical protein